MASYAYSTQTMLRLEKERRERLRAMPMDFQNPALYNRVYLPLFQEKSRFLHLFGSAGSGKSRFGCQKEIALSFDMDRKNRKTLVVRKVYSTIANSIYSELKTVIYEWNLAKYFDILKSPLQITNKRTGVVFAFIGLDDIEKVKSISGVDRMLIEEATELKEQSELDQLSLRLRGFDQVQITLMYNPVSVHHWINREIHEKLPPDHFIFKTTYRDNERLLEKDPLYAESIERLAITNPNYYKIYGLGEWGNQVEGLIYPEYKIASHLPEVGFYGLDFGYNDPCALIAGCVRDEADKPKKQYYVKECLYESKLTSDTLGDRLDSLGVRKDRPIYADCSRPEMIVALQRRGYWVMASEKGKGSVKAGIDHVKTHDLNIVAGSKELIREVLNYSWKNKNGEWLDEPIDGADHLCDAARYGLAGKPQEVTVRSIWD